MLPTLSPVKIQYPDRWVIVAGAVLLGHFFVILGRDESLLELWQQSFYYRDVAGTALIVAAVWVAIRTTTVFLDRSYDWLQAPAQRMISQFLLGFLLPVLVALVGAFLLFMFVVKQDISKSSFPVYEFPVAVLVIGMINLLYVGYYFYFKATAGANPAPPPAPEAKPAETPPPAPEPEGEKEMETISKGAAPAAGGYKKNIIVNSGYHNIPLATSKIAFFQKEQDHVYVCTTEGQKYLLSSTLDELMQVLDPHLFFRANRQFILHRQACKSFVNESFGKLKVEVVVPASQDLVVSQTKAPEFKKWLEA